MKLIQKFSNSSLAKTSTLVSLVSVLAVIGPFVVVSAGFWDAISHLQKEPEFFWSIPHIVVYTGVSITASAAIIGTILLLRNSTKNSLKNGIILVITGSLIQIIAGYADSLSHSLFGIDGLLSWSHQPLEFGLILSALNTSSPLPAGSGTSSISCLSTNSFSLLRVVLESYLGINFLREVAIIIPLK